MSSSVFLHFGARANWPTSDETDRHADRLGFVNFPKLRILISFARFPLSQHLAVAFQSLQLRRSHNRKTLLPHGRQAISLPLRDEGTKLGLLVPSAEVSQEQTGVFGRMTCNVQPSTLSLSLLTPSTPSQHCLYHPSMWLQVHLIPAPCTCTALHVCVHYVPPVLSSLPHCTFKWPPWML